MTHHSSQPCSPYHNAPLELRRRNQWVCWRRELCKGRDVKPPYQPNRLYASSTDPRTWHSFDECAAAALEHPDFFDGVGFCFSENNPYFALDLDAIFRSDAAEAPPWAGAIIEGFRGAYIEESPSGTGAHIIGRGQLPAGSRHQWVYQPPGEPKLKPYRVEIFASRRFFTFTGRSNGVMEIGDCQEYLDALLAELPKLFAALEGELQPPRPATPRREPAARTIGTTGPRPPHPGGKLGAGEGRYILLRNRALYLWRYPQQLNGLSQEEVEREVLALNSERCNPPLKPKLIHQLILDTARRYPR